jgi:hypothetical protein
MWKAAKDLEVGVVTINDMPAHVRGYFAFGGFKDSGMGSEGVGYSIDEMTNLKTTVFNLAAGGLGKKEVDAARCRVGMATNPRFKRSYGE